MKKEDLDVAIAPYPIVRQELKKKAKERFEETRKQGGQGLPLSGAWRSALAVSSAVKEHKLQEKAPQTLAERMCGELASLRASLVQLPLNELGQLLDKSFSMRQRASGTIKDDSEGDDDELSDANEGLIKNIGCVVDWPLSVSRCHGRG